MKTLIKKLFLLFAIVSIANQSSAQVPRVAVIDSMSDERIANIGFYNDSLLVVCGYVERHPRCGGLVCLFDKDLNLKHYVFDGSLYSTQFNSLSMQSDTVVLFGSSRYPFGDDYRQGLIYKFHNDDPIGFYPFGGTKRDSFITGLCLKKAITDLE